MRRTTAGINFFRINAQKNESTEETGWTPDTEEPQDASSILEKTIADNKVLRTANVIQERVFDIELDEPLCEMRKDTSLVIVDIPGLNEADSSEMYMDYVGQQWDTYDCVIVVMDALKGVNTEEQVSLLKFVKEKQAMMRDVPIIVLCNKVDDSDHEEVSLLVDEVRAKVDCLLNPQSDADATAPSFSFAKPSSDAASEKAAPITPVNFADNLSPVKPVGKREAPSFSFSSSKPTSPFGFAGDASPGSPFCFTFGSSLGETASSVSSSAFALGTNDHANSVSSSAPTSTTKEAAQATSARSRSQESPVFIPISAENAFIYRTVSHLPLEEFKKLDNGIIDRLGVEEAGRMRWKAMSLEEKYSIVHNAVSDPSTLKQRLEATNFESLLKALTHFVGGEDTQTNILLRQIDVATHRIRGTMRDIAGQLRLVYEISKAVGKPTDHLKSQFWMMYAALEKNAFASLQRDMSLDALHHCMDELIGYSNEQNKVLYMDGTTGTSNTEEAKVIATMKELVKHQVLTLLQKRSEWKIEGASFLTTPSKIGVGRSREGHVTSVRCESPIGARTSYNVAGGQMPPASNPFYWTRAQPAAIASPKVLWFNSVTGASVKSTNNPDLPQPTWSNLSPDDWIMIVNSITLLVHDQHFSESFGRELNELELLKAEVMPFVQNAFMQTRKDFLSGEYSDGKFTPEDPTKYSLVRQIRIPESPADPAHWGHLAWKFCQFKKSL